MYQIVAICFACATFRSVRCRPCRLCVSCFRVRHLRVVSVGPIASCYLLPARKRTRSLGRASRPISGAGRPEGARNRPDVLALVLPLGSLACSSAALTCLVHQFRRLPRALRLLLAASGRLALERANSSASRKKSRDERTSVRHTDTELRSALTQSICSTQTSGRHHCNATQLLSAHLATAAANNDNDNDTDLTCPLRPKIT